MKPILALFLSLASFAPALGANPAGADLRQRLALISGISPGTSYNTDFCFLFSWMHQNGEAAFAILQKHNADIALLECNGRGEPIAFLKNSFGARLDPKNTAGLVVCDDAAWQFLVKKAGGGLELGLSLSPRGENSAPGLNWDPASVVSAAFEHEQDFTFEQACNLYLFRTTHADLEVGLDSPIAEHSNATFLHYYDSDSIVSALRLRPEDSSRVHLAQVDEKDIKRLGVPISLVGREAFANNTGPLPITEDPKLRATAATFATLLPIRSCLALWLLSNESQRLEFANSIAADYAHTADQTLQLKKIIDRRRDKLDRVASEFEKGEIEMSEAVDGEHFSSDAAVELHVAMSQHDYPSFAKRYMAVQRALPRTPEPREAIFKAMAMIHQMNVGLPAECGVSEACLELEAKLAVLADGCFTDLIDKDQQKARTAETWNTFYGNLCNSLGRARADTVVGACFKEGRAI